MDELINGGNIAGDRLPLDACAGFDADGDGSVAINELVQAVNRALTGCA